MTDLEITRKCAEAMGLNFEVGGEDDNGNELIFIGGLPYGDCYEPLHDDAQLSALIKHHKKLFSEGGILRHIFRKWADGEIDDLNRAICLCVAAMDSGRQITAPAT